MNCALVDDFVVITWGDGEKNSYPFVWLRDHCLCKKCFNPTTQSKNMLMAELHVDVEVRNFKVNMPIGLCIRICITLKIYISILLFEIYGEDSFIS